MLELRGARSSTFDTTTGYILDIHFLNANTGYACADSSTNGNSCIIKTTNGGINWMKINLEQGITLNNIFFIDANTGFTCGYIPSAPYGGFIFKTTNGGLNWSKKSFLYPSVMETRDICFLNATTGIALNYAEFGILKIFKSTNTGTTWDSVTSFGTYFTSEYKFCKRNRYSINNWLY